VPYRPTWPCAKPAELKTLVHQEFYGTLLGHLEVIPTFTSQKPWISFFHKIPHQAIYLSRATPTNLAMFKTHRTQNIGAPRILRYSFGALGGHSHLYISKTMNFIFSQKTPPSHLPKPWHTDQFGHVQNVPNSKHLCTNNFMVLMLGHLEAIPTFTSQKPWISFFHKIPHEAIYLSRVTRPTWPCSKHTKLKTFVHQEFYGTHLVTFGGHSNLHISKTMNLIFYKTLH